MEEGTKKSEATALHEDKEGEAPRLTPQEEAIIEQDAPTRESPSDSINVFEG